jgi:hypothetical protein
MLSIFGNSTTQFVLFWKISKKIIFKNVRNFFEKDNVQTYPLYNFFRCPSVATAPPCTVVEDLQGVYPTCCPRVQCPTIEMVDPTENLILDNDQVMMSSEPMMTSYDATLGQVIYLVYSFIVLPHLQYNSWNCCRLHEFHLVFLVKSLQSPRTYSNTSQHSGLNHSQFFLEFLKNFKRILKEF